jgi:uncharacterized phage protein (TIGR01671 family)
MYVRLASIRSRIGENMDRYLYKAKRLDNGEWVQGVPFKVEGKWVLLINDNENLLRTHYIEENMWTAEIYAIEVDSTTICQCTGLKDKNGKLIWENDIVKINNSKGNVLITFGDFEIICTIPNEKYYKHRLEYDTEYEVVGNIFDNPELLESEG